MVQSMAGEPLTTGPPPREVNGRHDRGPRIDFADHPRPVPPKARDRRRERHACQFIPRCRTL
jgi:hypothetical protein